MIIYLFYVFINISLFYFGVGFELFSDIGFNFGNALVFMIAWAFSDNPSWGALCSFSEWLTPPNGLHFRVLRVVV